MLLLWGRNPNAASPSMRLIQTDPASAAWRGDARLRLGTVDLSKGTNFEACVSSSLFDRDAASSRRIKISANIFALLTWREAVLTLVIIGSHFQTGCVTDHTMQVSPR
jgi:hypothetical protein